jgi:alpha,alpha-trehalase
MIYRWLWLITNAVKYNGTIPEKFNLETSSHKFFAEYGNVGTEFDYISKEGFGWVACTKRF